MNQGTRGPMGRKSGHGVVFMTHHRRQQRKVQEARKSPDRPDGCARSQLSPNSDEPGGGAGDEPSGEAGDVPAVGRVLSRAVRRVLSRARVRETIVQCCIPKSQAAAAVKHTAHNLRTPKHEGLYRYGRRCGRCCCCSTQRARARAHTGKEVSWTLTDFPTGESARRRRRTLGV